MAMPALSRRKLVGAIGAALPLLLAACAPAAPPTSTPAPAKPAEAAKPPAAEPTKPAAAPAAATAAPTTAAPAAAAATPAPATPTAAAAAAAKPQPTATPPPPQLKAGEKLVTVMYNPGEFTDKHVEQFEKENPGTRVYRVSTDLVQLVAMTAAGNPPDMFRVQAADIPSFLTRKMVKDLSDSFRGSKLIKIDDLSEANKNYWYDGLNPGKAKI